MPWGAQDTGVTSYKEFKITTLTAHRYSGALEVKVETEEVKDAHRLSQPEDDRLFVQLQLTCTDWSGRLRCEACSTTDTSRPTKDHFTRG